MTSMKDDQFYFVNVGETEEDVLKKSKEAGIEGVKLTLQLPSGHQVEVKKFILTGKDDSGEVFFAAQGCDTVDQTVKLMNHAITQTVQLLKQLLEKYQAAEEVINAVGEVEELLRKYRKGE